MRNPLLVAVAAGFVAACGLSVATSADSPPSRAGAAVTARERPASVSAPVVLAPLPPLRHERRRAPAPRAHAVAAATRAAPIVAASPPASPPPAQETVAAPPPAPPAPAPAPVAAPKPPAPTPQPEFDSSEEVFDSAG